MRTARRWARRKSPPRARTSVGSYPPFEIPADVYAGWDARAKGAGLEKAWSDRFAEYAREHPELAAEFERRMAGKLPADWRSVPARLVVPDPEKAETHRYAQGIAERTRGLGRGLPELIGGSADLAASNLTLWSGSTSAATRRRRQLHLLRRARVRHVGAS